jgi:predicted DNA-binding protein
MTSDFQPTYVRLPRDLHDAIVARAKADDRTMAQAIRVAIRYYLANVKPE